MSDEARQPIPDQQPTGPHQEPARLSLSKEQERTGAEPVAGGQWEPVPVADSAAAETDRWASADVREPASDGRRAPVADRTVPGADREPVQDAVPGLGSAAGRDQATVHDAVPGSGSVTGRDQAAVHGAVPGLGSFPGQNQAAVPAPGSVHDQQTLTSLPTAAPADDGRAAWASPAGGFAPPASGSTAQPANPFAPPAPGPSAQQPNPFAPPAAEQQPNPFAPPAPVPQPNPFAPPANPFPPHAGADPVPPPPIAPDGPGQVPYGYPGTMPAYGYPGPQQTPYTPYPAGTGYGWPGMQMPPSNGMGTASLVLGIISAVGFLMWPVALVLGILALIFGGIGRGKAGRGEATNPGVALAGIICGAAGIVLVLGLFALIIAARG
ncbi:hypothetical protein ABZ923_02510 [Streptomyces sp. NPDC046881]|uniref:hypothetical protein n=1 Tax=Streptomyces sp. NPDC046881 TaxID=3155374 RepID=UPI0033E21545